MIVGGSIEIIRFAQQSLVGFGGALTACAFYFRNEIFEWAFEMQGNNESKLTKISPAGTTVFCQACRIGNVERMLRCVELGVDLNAEDIDSFPLSLAVFGGSDEAVEILLSLCFHSYSGLASQGRNSNAIEQANSNSNSNISEKVNLNSPGNGENEVIVIKRNTQDDIQREDDPWSEYSQALPLLNLKGRIKVDKILFAMQDAATEDQLDRLKLFFKLMICL